MLKDPSTPVYCCILSGFFSSYLEYANCPQIRHIGEFPKWAWQETTAWSFYMVYKLRWLVVPWLPYSASQPLVFFPPQTEPFLHRNSTSRHLSLLTPVTKRLFATGFTMRKTKTQDGGNNRHLFAHIALQLWQWLAQQASLQHNNHSV